MKFTTTVQQYDDTQDLFIEIPHYVLQNLNWEEGDELAWSIKQGQIILTKVKNSNSTGEEPTMSDYDWYTTKEKEINDTSTAKAKAKSTKTTTKSTTSTSKRRTKKPTEIKVMNSRKLEYFPHVETFPIFLNDLTENKRCWFTCIDHAQKYITRYNHKYKCYQYTGS